MRRAWSLLGVPVAAILLWTALAPSRDAAAGTVPEDALYVPGEVVVVFRGRGGLARSLAQARSLARGVGGKVARVGSGRSAVIRGAPGADMATLVRRLSARANVRFAEPNYIYRATGTSGTAASSAYVVRRIAGQAGTMTVPKAALRAMRTRTRAGIRATYPTDKLLWENAGWDWVNASILWNNTTPSKNVCAIDTGVDYLHPDLTTSRVIKGWDCVNEDADPMDDNGHGTHVAGIIAAKQNNAQGIAGVSPTAKVVAVKALNADGWGTNFDIAQAIAYCYKRSDISIINMSFGGPYSKLQEIAVDQATVARGKLVVASAGNESSDMPYCTETTGSGTNAEGVTLNPGVRSYPAGFALASPRYKREAGSCIVDPAYTDPLHFGYDAVFSAGAGGSGSDFDYRCKAEDSNFGDWVNITAPGANILSTTPWDRPFTMNVEEEVPFRYAAFSGTSSAAAFVSGAAARIWGYLPSGTTNLGLAAHMKSDQYGFAIDANGSCWPVSMAGVTDVNVARAMGRGGLTADAIDAVTGLPLTGATIKAFQGAEVKASAVVPSTKIITPEHPLGYFPATVDLINLRCVDTTLKVYKYGYTNADSAAFAGGEFPYGNADGTIEVPEGGFLYAGYAAVPPKSARFTAVSAWDFWEDRPAPLLTTSLPERSSKTYPDSQPFNFVVGYNVCDDTRPDPDPTGELSAFPNAQVVYQNQNWVETHQIMERKAGVSTLPGNSALPQWTGDYVFRVHDPQGAFADRQGSLFIWKDGTLKKRVDLHNPSLPPPNCDASTEWWEAAKLSSGSSGSATITELNQCTTSVTFPGQCP